LELVAERGFHGTGMAAVAKRAGVAAGTAYVHYDSKDELIIAAYLEVKADLGAAALAGLDREQSPRQRFRQVWYNIYTHLAADPARARYMIQLESSPIGRVAHERAMEREDPFVEAGQDMVPHLVDLPPSLIWELGFGPALRLAADPDLVLDEAQLDGLAEACWRAIRKP
jgi:TetR/AcrR family transcriptional repressor of multidrug resistance operon